MGLNEVFICAVSVGKINWQLKTRAFLLSTVEFA